MDIRTILRTIALTTMGAGTLIAQRATLASRILQLSEADQIAYVVSDLSQGMPADQYGPLGMLVLNRSSLVLPIIERKIEEVLKSPSPIDCFADKTVDPRKFVDLAAWTIPDAGDEIALMEVSKLIAIDEARFGMLVRNTMAAAQNRGNPFDVAYRGFEIGDPGLDRRILAWIEPQFSDKTDFRQGQLKRWWAEAMVDKYGGIPTEVSWASDPIATRINPALAAALHDEIFRLGVEAYDKKIKK